jgi:hypothetical protein
MYESAPRQRLKGKGKKKGKPNLLIGREGP